MRDNFGRNVALAVLLSLGFVFGTILMGRWLGPSPAPITEEQAYRSTFGGGWNLGYKAGYEAGIRQSATWPEYRALWERDSLLLELIIDKSHVQTQ